MISRLLAVFMGVLFVPCLSGGEVDRGTPSELAAALAADPDPGRGAGLYEPCAACHQSTGWGVLDGSVPQIAGQIYEVILKQISDFRDGERIHPRMMPFVTNRYLEGPQDLADVAAYVADLPPATRSSTGTGDDLEQGQALYQDSCAFCHGQNAQGNAITRIPRLAGQHYPYIARQIRWLGEGIRHNIPPDVAGLLASLSDEEVAAVSDYISRLSVSQD